MHFFECPDQCHSWGTSLFHFLLSKIQDRLKRVWSLGCDVLHTFEMYQLPPFVSQINLCCKVQILLYFSMACLFSERVSCSCLGGWNWFWVFSTATHGRNSELLCVKCVSSKRGKSLTVLSKPGLSNYSMTKINIFFSCHFSNCGKIYRKEKKRSNVREQIVWGFGCFASLVCLICIWFLAAFYGLQWISWVFSIRSSKQAETYKPEHWKLWTAQKEKRKSSCISSSPFLLCRWTLKTIV